MLHFRFIIRTFGNILREWLIEKLYEYIRTYFDINTRDTYCYFINPVTSHDTIGSCWFLFTLSIAGKTMRAVVGIYQRKFSRERKREKDVKDAMSINSYLFARYYRWCIDESTSTKHIALSRFFLSFLLRALIRKKKFNKKYPKYHIQSIIYKNTGHFTRSIIIVHYFLGP